MPNGEFGVMGNGGICIFNARGQVVRSIACVYLLNQFDERSCDSPNGLAYCQKTNSLFTYQAPDDGYACFDAFSGEVKMTSISKGLHNSYSPTDIAIHDGRMFVLHMWEDADYIESCTIIDTATFDVIVRQVDGYKLAFPDGSPGGNAENWDKIAVDDTHLAIKTTSNEKKSGTIHFWDLCWPEKPKYSGYLTFNNPVHDLDFQNGKLFVLVGRSIVIYESVSDPGQKKWKRLSTSNFAKGMRMSHISVDQYYIHVASFRNKNVHTLAILPSDAISSNVFKD